MQRNVASQKWRCFAFDISTNAPKTGDAANITAKISKDFGVATATNDVNPTELELGFYEFDLTQAETNADDLLLICDSSTASISVLGCPTRIATTPAGWSDDVIQTGDSFARIGAAGASLTNIGDTRMANLDAAVTTRLAPTVSGRTLDVSTTGEAGVDWANVGSPTTTLNLSGTTVKTATDVETDTADIQGRLPAALVSGRIDASAGAVAAGAITAAAIATDAIDADALAADAVTEIATGMLDLAAGVETGLTLRQAMRLIAAASAGKLSGAATTTITIRNAVADSKDRITATVSADGNRSAIVYDLT